MKALKSFEEELFDLQEAYSKKIEKLEKWTEEQILAHKMSEEDALSEIENANKQFSASLLFLKIKHGSGIIEPNVDPEDETIASYYLRTPQHVSNVTVSFSPQGLFKTQ